MSAGRTCQAHWGCRCGRRMTRRTHAGGTPRDLAYSPTTAACSSSRARHAGRAGHAHRAHAATRAATRGRRGSQARRPHGVARALVQPQGTRVVEEHGGGTHVHVAVQRAAVGRQGRGGTGGYGGPGNTAARTHPRSRTHSPVPTQGQIAQRPVPPTPCRPTCERRYRPASSAITAHAPAGQPRQSRFAHACSAA